MSFKIQTKAEHYFDLIREHGTCSKAIASLSPTDPIEAAKRREIQSHFHAAQGAFEKYTTRELNKHQSEAAKMCASCPVRNECLQYALIVNEPASIWGGYNSTIRGLIISGVFQSQEKNIVPSWTQEKWEQALAWVKEIDELKAIPYKLFGYSSPKTIPNYFFAHRVKVRSKKELKVSQSSQI